MPRFNAGRSTGVHGSMLGSLGCNTGVQHGSMLEFSAEHRFLANARFNWVQHWSSPGSMLGSTLDSIQVRRSGSDSILGLLVGATLGSM